MFKLLKSLFGNRYDRESIKRWASIEYPRDQAWAIHVWETTGNMPGYGSVK
jgi:hypothetical protein